jgi:multicomponent Na+:H+ antiporter subunit F
MSPRRIRWAIGFVLCLGVLAAVILLPAGAMLGWQSPFLARAFWWLLFTAFLCLWRVLKGPTASDCAVAVDMLGILIIGFCAILCIATGRSWYIDIGIAWALQSFIGVMALAKYLEGKSFDE